MKSMKKNNKKGFTLAELLIVVAIIAVLVAIAIPVFSKQLESSREAVDAANIRAAYAEAAATALANNSDTTVLTTEAKQKEAEWTRDFDWPAAFTDAPNAKTSGVYSVTVTTSGSATVS